MSSYFRLTLTQSALIGTETFNNVFFYKTDALLPVNQLSLALFTAFALEIYTATSTNANTPLGFINTIQSADVVNDNMEVVDLYNPLDFFTSGLGGQGVQGGPTNSFVDAITYRTSRVRRDIRRGRKRFTGVTDAWAEQGLLNLTTPQQTALDDVREVLGAVISDGSTTPVTFTPVIMKRTPVLVNGRKVYRLPLTAQDADAEHFEALTWEQGNYVSTQTTRIRNRSWS